MKLNMTTKAKSPIYFLFLFITANVISFINFTTIEAQFDPYYEYQNCSNENTKVNSSYQLHVKKLFSSLSSNARFTEFYNTTIIGKNPSDSSIYGLFMCRGDVSSKLCQQCVRDAVARLSTEPECSLSKQAVIWYDECMVRYSNHSFFSVVDTWRGFYKWNFNNITDQGGSFNHSLSLITKEAIDNAANSTIVNKKFATREAHVSENQTIYFLAQCTPDLSPNDCRECLENTINDEGNQGGIVLYPSCNIRYEMYPFYLSTSEISSSNLIPATKNSVVDTKFSEDPIYLHHNCSITNATTTTSNDGFQVYLTTLLSQLSSNATSGNKLFHQVEIFNSYYLRGLFMCRGDLPTRLCGQCVLNAAHRISSECQSSSRDTIIWYNHCMIRYSYRYIFYNVDKSPTFSKLNITNSSTSQNLFTFALSNTLAKLASAVARSEKKYLTKSIQLNDLQTLYSLGQCTQDLTGSDCLECLQDVIANTIPWSRLGSIGGRVMYPSCNLRFEMFQFYRDGEEPQLPRTHTSEKRKSQTRKIVFIVIPTIVLVMLCSFSCYILNRIVLKSHKAILKENFGDESATLEPLQLNFAVIKAATNNFSNENKIGTGGFGEVYKGVLLDGRQIAVKRLSQNSKQGATEFKNEVLSIAKLQHRNLVAFIGFCLEGQEKILIYEYLTNKSLDYFLFDSQRQRSLSWSERYEIVGGITRGILYLHQHSRLKVIHRDLKPSNILLDENMTPKISDFGLARIVDINEDHISTNWIAGTHGYMSPEYFLLGQYSEKSDVFSFGVIILEIITGKKNRSSYESLSFADGLLIHVWRQWRNETPLSILDTNIVDHYNEIEVIKCIQIGLLCVQQDPNERPTMAAVVSYLYSNLTELPTPQEPAFFASSRMDPQTLAEESTSGQPINNASTQISNSKVSTSEFLPR